MEENSVQPLLKPFLSECVLFTNRNTKTLEHAIRRASQKTLVKIGFISVIITKLDKPKC